MDRPGVRHNRDASAATSQRASDGMCAKQISLAQQTRPVCLLQCQAGKIKAVAPVPPRTSSSPYAHPPPIADLAPPQRWSPADGQLPPGKCRVRGCPAVLPSGRALCTDHAREVSSGNAHRYVWHGDPLLAAGREPAEGVPQQELARTWAGIFCEFNQQFPAVWRELLWAAYRPWLADRSEVTASSARILYVVLAERGAVPVRVLNAHGFAGVRLAARDSAVTPGTLSAGMALTGV